MKITIEELDEKHFYVEVTKTLFKENAVCHSLPEALKKACNIATDED